MSTAPDTLLTPGQTAEILRLPIRKVIGLAQSGVWPSVELPGGDLRFDSAELLKWINQRRRGREGRADG
jgi:hypothetical protein